MKKFCYISVYSIMLGLIVIFYSCENIPKPQPDITTSDILSVTKYTAKCGGNIISDFGATVNIRGVCWSTSTPPTINDKKTYSGSGLGSFLCYLNELTPGTKYYVRAFYTNDAGTGYGNVRTFTTLEENLPILTTTSATAITKTTAVSGGNITSDGGSRITKRGVCWSTGSNPTIYSLLTSNDTGKGSYISNISGLSPKTTYYVRAYATNQNGTSYGNLISFTTSAGDLAVLTTSPVTLITPYSAKSGGHISSNGGSTIPIKGVCWGTSPDPTIYDQMTADGPGNSDFSSFLTNLTPNTTYYIRAYANNDAGTAYGNELTFTTAPLVSGYIYDIDGNLYHSVIIGTQEWMVENLKVTHYRNGEAVKNVTGYYDWQQLKTGAYSDYNNVPDTGLVFGRLYNWYTVNDSRTIAPIGWHIPSDSEWTVLSNYLGGEAIAGGKLKESGFTHWKSPNTGATNESGFTAYAGGYKEYNSAYYNLNENGTWWSTSVNLSGNVICRVLYYNNNTIGRFHRDKTYGYSIRCVRDK